MKNIDIYSLYSQGIKKREGGIFKDDNDKSVSHIIYRLSAILNRKVYCSHNAYIYQNFTPKSARGGGGRVAFVIS